MILFKRILVAVDRSAPSDRALRVAVELAEQLHARIGALHVIDSSRAFVPALGSGDRAVLTSDNALLASLKRAGELMLDEACGLVPEALMVERMCRVGDPAEMIISMADEWGADLIAVGSDSRGRLAHFLLGSAADAVVRRSTCPVITVRAGASMNKPQEAAAAVSA